MVTSWSLFLDFWTDIRQNKNTEPLPNSSFDLVRAISSVYFWAMMQKEQRFILPITTRNDGKSLWHSILLDCADLSAMQSCSKYMFIQWTPIKVVKSLRLFGRPNRAEHRSSDTTSTYSPSYNLLFQSTWWHHDGNTMSHQQPGTNLQFLLSSHYFW